MILNMSNFLAMHFKANNKSNFVNGLIMIRVMKESMVRCRIMTFDLKGDLLVLLLIELIIFSTQLAR